MSAKMKSVVLLVVVILSFALWGVVAAQNNNDGERPFLGVQLQNTDEGVVIDEVVPNSAAEDAGLEEGDVITAVNGTEVTTAREVAELIAELNPGDTVTIDFTRDGEADSVEVTLGSTRAIRSIDIPFRLFQRGGDLSISYDAVNQTWTIEELSEDSELYEAGLREDDVITAINGEPLDPMSLREFLDEQDDDDVTVTVERDGETLDIEVPASALEMLGFGGTFRFGEGRGFPFDGFPFREGRGMPFGMLGGQGRLGIAYVTLNEAAAEEHGVDVTEGALVTEVLPNSPAENAGLQEHDIITAVNGDVVDAERTLRDRLFAYEPDDTITLDVLRDGETIQIEVTLGQPELASDLMPFFNFEIPNLRDALQPRVQPNI